MPARDRSALSCSTSSSAPRLHHGAEARIDAARQLFSLDRDEQRNGGAEIRAPAAAAASATPPATYRSRREPRAHARSRCVSPLASRCAITGSRLASSSCMRSRTVLGGDVAPMGAHVVGDRRYGGQTLGQRLEVEAGAADDDRAPTLALRLLQHPRDVGGIASRRIALGRRRRTRRAHAARAPRPRASAAP